jgi:TIR domain
LKLFVSYSHADIRFVRKLCDDLSKYGYQVWRDERDLRVGDSIAEKVREAIDRADFFLLVISPESIVSPWVRREIDVGLNAELDGDIRKFLPILYRGVEVPSLVKGRLYADFRPGKYRSGFAALLKTLDFDLSSLPILAGCIIKHRHISLVCQLLLSQGYRPVKSWNPIPARLEITSGYLSYMRGHTDARSGDVDVFSPMSPIPIADGTPALIHEDTQVQICFAALRTNLFQNDTEIQDSSIIMLPSWRFVIYFLGKSSPVREVIAYLSDYAVENQIKSIKHDLPDLLGWWNRPSLPLGPQVTIFISGRLVSMD